MTKSTRVEYNGSVLKIEKSWIEGPNGGQPDCWDIVNQREEMTDRFESLWQAKAQMERYISYGGKVAAS